MTPEEALAYCLTEIEAGRKTAAECLALFPDMPGLKAQLQAAQALRAWRAPAISPEAARRLEARVRQRTRAPRPNRAGLFGLPLKWVVALATLIFFFISAGAVTASADSLPGDALYPVKRTGESVQLLLTPASNKAALHTLFAERRLNELAALAERGFANSEAIAVLAAEITAETGAALDALQFAPKDSQPALIQNIVTETQQQQAILEQVKATAPSHLQVELDRALQESIQQATAAIQKDGGFPGETASPTSTPTLTLTAVEATTTSVTTEAAQTSSNPTATTIAIVLQPPTGTLAPPQQPTEPQQAHTPPGQARKIETTSAQQAGASTPAPTSHNGNADGNNGNNGANPATAPNCNANNPNSPNYCTPAPSSATATPPAESNPAPTACPTNASGKPKCK
ncbi:MAG: hypothetical protein HYZ49_02700 [Chloroflexi bacterium]|nr:hypothetical protein [Chloroflexota bacterium]